MLHQSSKIYGVFNQKKNSCSFSPVPEGYNLQRSAGYLKVVRVQPKKIIVFSSPVPSPAKGVHTQKEFAYFYLQTMLWL